MKPSTKVALAALLQAAGSLISAFARELDGSSEPEAAAAPEQPKRGRRTTATQQPEPTPEPTPTPTPAAEEQSEEQPTGKTYEELRAIIEPAVKDGRGEDVKKIIDKYVGKTKALLKELEAMPQHHAAFEKDVAALLY